MKRLASILLAFALVGCAAESSPIDEPRQRELRKMLAESFTLTAVREDKKDEFYRVLEVVSKKRKQNEFVSAVDFLSSDQALVWLSIDGRENGLVELERKRGHWIVTRKSHAE